MPTHVLFLPACTCDNIKLERKQRGPRRSNPPGPLLYSKEGILVPYRKVTYREQIWYIIKFKLREIFRRRKKK